MTRTSFSSEFNKSSTQSSSRKNDFKSKNRDYHNKPTEQNAPKVSASSKCYRWQGHGHMAAKYDSEIKITFIDRIPTEAHDSDSEEFAYQSDPDEDDDSNYNQEDSSVECNCTQITSSNYISIVRCAFSQYEEKNDWRRTVISTHSLRLEEKSEK